MNDIGHVENPLAQEFTIFSLLRFAAPSMIMMLFMGLYTIVDSIFIARFVNTNALSAVNIVCPVVNLIVGLGTMLATGGSAMIAREMGEGKRKRAQQDFTFLISFGLGIGFLIALLGFPFRRELLYSLGASAVLLPYGEAYLSVLLLFTPMSILQVLFQNLFVTAGRPGLGMFLAASAGMANVAFDYLFLVPLKMGVAGAALGTGIGYSIPALCGIIVFLRRRGTLYFRRPVWRPRLLTKSCSNGCSEMVSQAASAVTTFLFNRSMMNLLGEDGVAAVTIMIYTQFLLTALYIGFSMGIAPVLSYNFGKGNRVLLRKVFKMGLIFILCSSLLIFFAAWYYGSSLIQLFVSSRSPVFPIAEEGFKIFPIGFLTCGVNLYCSASFTALSDGKRSAAISFLRTFGFIAGSLFLLPRLIGVIGVWLAVPVAEGLTSLVAIVLLWRNRKQFGFNEMCS